MSGLQQTAFRRVLIIGWVWPEPKASAAGEQMLAIIRLMQSVSEEIHFASPAQKTELSFPLESIGVQTSAIDVNNSSFDLYLADLSPDVVIFDRYMMEEQFGWRVDLNCPDAIRILDTEDLHSLREARQKALTNGSKLDLNTEKALREIASIHRCDTSLIISRDEFDLLQRHYQVPQSWLVNLPLRYGAGDINPDNSHLAKMLGYEHRTDFISIGNFRHPPNWDSVLWLRELWPSIRAQIPNAKLHIYGAYLPAKAKQLHNEKLGFYVHGWIEDAFLAMSRARVCLAPLRFGAGQKGKLVLAAMAATPSVSTTVGAESMMLEETLWPGVIADKESEFINAAVRLYTDEDFWISAHSRCDAYDQYYNKKPNWGNELVTRLIYLKENLAQHRNSNFVSLMLRHHHHRSTQFMSQWIEAKNQLADLKDSD